MYIYKYCIYIVYIYCIYTNIFWHYICINTQIYTLYIHIYKLCIYIYHIHYIYIHYMCKVSVYTVYIYRVYVQKYYIKTHKYMYSIYIYTYIYYIYIDWLIDWLVGWLVGWLSVCCRIFKTIQPLSGQRRKISTPWGSKCRDESWSLPTWQRGKPQRPQRQRAPRAGLNSQPLAARQSSTPGRMRSYWFDFSVLKK